MTQQGSLVRVVLGASTTPTLVWEKGGECPALPILFSPSPLSLLHLHLTPSLPHPISTTIPFPDELIERCYQNFSLFLNSNLIFWYHWQFLSPANSFSPSSPPSSSFHPVSPTPSFLVGIHPGLQKVPDEEFLKSFLVEKQFLKKKIDH